MTNSSVKRRAGNKHLPVTEDTFTLALDEISFLTHVFTAATAEMEASSFFCLLSTHNTTPVSYTHLYTTLSPCDYLEL